MELKTHAPILIPAKTAVLLAFLPPANRGETSLLSSLVDMLQQKLKESIRVLKINESTHPEVVQSFSVKRLPTFVLVQQGIEVWRQEGPSEETEI